MLADLAKEKRELPTCDGTNSSSMFLLNCMSASRRSTLWSPGSFLQMKSIRVIDAVEVVIRWVVLRSRTPQCKKAPTSASGHDRVGRREKWYYYQQW